MSQKKIYKIFKKLFKEGKDKEEILSSLKIKETVYNLWLRQFLERTYLIRENKIYYDDGGCFDLVFSYNWCPCGRTYKNDIPVNADIEVKAPRRYKKEMGYIWKERSGLVWGQMCRHCIEALGAEFKKF